MNKNDAVNKLSRKQFLGKSLKGIGWSVLGSYWFTLSGCRNKTVKNSKTSRPNVLLIVSDDQGWNDIGFHGSEIKTPNLDKLAKENVQLNQFYVCPTCSPTRAALLTGRYPSRFGIYGPIGGKSSQTLPKEILNLPKLLKENGYATALIGKWHLGLTFENGPNHYGFDYTYGYLHGQIDQYKHVYKNGDKTWHRNGTLIEEKGHATDLITKEAKKYIISQRDKSKPFFLQVTFSVPHYPLQEENRWIQPYNDIIENPSRKLFAASVTHLDYSVQEILNSLQEAGIKEDTIVIYFSDNGGQEKWIPAPNEYNGEHGPNDVLGDNRPLRNYKQSLYEGGIRVPAIVSWPGKIKPNQVDEVISVTDILPTLASLAGAQINPLSELDGKNVWSAIASGGCTGKREIYGRTKQQIALRDGDWKLVHNGNSLNNGSNELYNLKDDPYERNNLARENPEIVEKMKNKILKISETDLYSDFPDA